MKKRFTALILCCSLLCCACGEGTQQKNTAEPTQESGTSWKLAQNSAFGKYPKTVTYTLGKMTGLNNSNMPEGDTYEDNAYTRYLKQRINVQNKDAFEATESENYSNTLSMVIASNNIPDVMLVNDEETLQTLVDKDMIEDLTQVYQNCTSDRIKAIYDSYGDSMLEAVTYDGKLMALPGTNIDTGPSLLWLRKDWMDTLGLSAPTNMKEAEKIIQEFVRKDPGKNGAGKTMGLACGSDLTGGCGYSYEYQTDIVFAGEESYPKQWIKKDGNVVYGSVQPEAKQALKKLRQMYDKGTLDQDFLVRGSNNIIKQIVNGKCGAFFGPWWAPNNPLMQAMKDNPEAHWMPYLLQTDSNESTTFASQKPSDNYIVVRKGYKHPEIVMKIISVLFDDMRYGDSDKEELETYYQDNVDPTARPLGINVDFKDALNRCYESLKDALEGVTPLSKLGLLEGSFYISCSNYLKHPSTDAMTNWEDWAAYTSRITACSTLSRGKTKQIDSLYFGETASMKKNWWKLEEMEQEAYLAIVTGQKPLSYFDTFVSAWKKEGGTKITREVAQEVAKSGKQN